MNKDRKIIIKIDKIPHVIFQVHSRDHSTKKSLNKLLTLFTLEMLREIRVNSLDSNDMDYDTFLCCNSQHLVENRGHLVCSSCGLVFQRSIVNQYPRVFSDHPERIHSKPLMNDKCMRTIINISEVNKDQIFDWMRKTRHNYWYDNDCKDINHRQRFNQVCARLQHLGIELPVNLRETAWLLLGKVSKTNNIRGHNLDSMIKACIYVASQVQHSFLLLSELVEKPGESRHIFVCIRSINSVKGSFRTKRPLIPELILKLGGQLNVKMEIQQQAITLYQDSVSKGLVIQGKKTSIMAGSFLYISAMNQGERIEQKRIAQITKATEITLREDVKSILELIGVKNTILPISPALACFSN